AGRGRVGEERRERLAEPARGRRHLLVRALRRDLERDPQARSPRELAHEVVEHRQTRRDARRPLVVELDANRPVRRHDSTRSMWAPIWRSRSSIRSYPLSIWYASPIVDVPSAQSAAITIAIPARMSGLETCCP